MVPGSMLRADVRIRRGELDLAATLEVAAGQPQVVVGESGAGKTTLLRLLAGLERPDAGRITLGRELWFDAPSHTWVPAEGRAVGYVAQDDALFPHLTALDNVGFGGHLAHLRIGTTQLAATTQTSQELTAGHDAFMVVDPRDVVISIEPASGSAQNQLSGPILELAPEPPDGERLRIIIDSQPPLVAEITRAAAEQLRLSPGVTVHASFKATGAKAFR
jgi:ABC-type molybdate transport system ATPase subunit